MRIYFMRHGIAVDREATGEGATPQADAERPLTRHGTKKTKAAAKGLRAIGVEFDRVLTSPFVRARQTAKIVCDRLGIPNKKIESTEGALPDADPAAIFRELASSGPNAEGSVIVFGHAPHLDRAIALAMGNPAPGTTLKKAGLAVLDMESLEPPRGSLLMLVGPKHLAAMRD